MISKKGQETRLRILDTAQVLILERGFSGVSIDNVIERLGMSKGAFFHHFSNKNDLAYELIQRYADLNTGFFNACLAKSEKLSHDPLQQVLILIGLYEDLFDHLEAPHPGCLLASYIHEQQMFDNRINEIIRRVFQGWREALVKKLDGVMEKYSPACDVDIPSLADEFIVILQGAFILSKSLKDPGIVAQQLHHYKQYVELIFSLPPKLTDMIRTDSKHA